MTKKYLKQLVIRTICLLLISFLYLNATFSQLQLIDKTELYRDDVIPRIDVLINPESLEYILDPQNKNSDELFEGSFIFSNGQVLDTLNNIGFRLRGNTSRSAQKKSFKIDLNAFVPGRKYYGVTKINLNGQHNDPTSSRSKICADLADLIQIPSLRSNHVELYINGTYYGLYTNVEHVDQNYVKKRFGNKNGNLYKCLYPADLNYKGDNPDSYKEIIIGRRNYDLKSNEIVDDYSDFANFIKVLNLTPDANLACELEQVFNVDSYLKCIIFDILTGNWDGPIYNKNNFYLYHNQATDLFEYIPYDLDNTLGIDWLNKDWGNRNIYTWAHESEKRPLFTRIMENQEYKDRFSFYMQEILLNVYNESELYPYLDELKNKLKPYIENDLYYTLDYGFNLEIFETGFEYELPFFQTDYGIKSFIQTRLIAAFTQLELNDISPIIKYRKTNHPNKNEHIEFLATILDDNEIVKAEVCLRINDGEEFCVPLRDDGTSNDGTANDGLYGVILTPTLATGAIHYRIKATDDKGQESTSPRCFDQKLIIEEETLKLSINEFMASNDLTISDENGEFDDWIELYNYGTSPIYLGDKYLTDDIDNKNKWAMPNYVLEGGQYLLFWADDDRNQGSFHTNFKLSAGGEYIGIFDDESSGYALIDEIAYPEQETDISLGRIPNGTGDFINLSPSPGAPNLITGTHNTFIQKNKISIFPNPTENIVHIQSPYEIVMIKLYDSMGKTVDFKRTNDSIILPERKGVFFMYLYTDAKTLVAKKIIKI